MTDRKRIVSFDYFRALAILLIVFGHCGYNWRPDGALESGFENLIKGSTALFVFISGFFFYTVFYETFRFKPFFVKKLKNVFVPYCIMSVVGMGVMLAYGGHIAFHYPLAEDPLLRNSLNGVLNLVTGYTLPPYWYIPFIMLVFAISPFFVWMIRRTMRVQIVLTAVFFVAAMYIQRPSANLNPFHSLFYFMPLYMLGILYAQRRVVLEDLLSEWKGLFLSGAGVLSVLVLMGSVGQQGNMHKLYPWSYTGFDLMIVQNFFLIAFLLGLMKRFEQRRLYGFPFLAQSSFALFFIHPLVINLIERQWSPWEDGRATIGLEGSFAYFALVLSLSALCAVGVKKVAGTQSRYIIGW